MSDWGDKKTTIRISVYIPVHIPGPTKHCCQNNCIIKMENVNTGINIKDIYNAIPQLVPVFTHGGAVHNDMYWDIHILLITFSTDAGWLILGMVINFAEHRAHDFSWKAANVQLVLTRILWVHNSISCAPRATQPLLLVRKGATRDIVMNIFIELIMSTIA